MNPEIAMTIADERYTILRRQAADSRRRPARRLPPRLPGWRVNWSRTVLSADTNHWRGSSLVIIISARRPAR
jgi:hypothetical protein